MTEVEGRCGATVHACNDANELRELVHIVRLAPCRKHAVGPVTDLVPHPVVGIEECLHMPPRPLDRVRMSERRLT